MGINFCGHFSMVGTIVVGFAKYASYGGLIFLDKKHTTNLTKNCIPQNRVESGSHLLTH